MLPESIVVDSDPVDLSFMDSDMAARAYCP